jgi:thiamine biosynthesis protein ThiS
MMQVELNGKPRELPDASTVADLVAALGLEPQQVAVEINKTLVARDARAATVLSEGDRVELVTLVGGG